MDIVIAIAVTFVIGFSVGCWIRGKIEHGRRKLARRIRGKVL